uniref:(northern house mosquito) hypothetical protein n=1 Tax=Culex pipiens TaxID=7175 RepID=A0A8D8ATW1_CULPI
MLLGSDTSFFFSSFSSAAAVGAGPLNGISRPEAFNSSTDLTFSSLITLLTRVESTSLPTELRSYQCRHFRRGKRYAALSRILFKVQTENPIRSNLCDVLLALAHCESCSSALDLLFFLQV